MGKLRAHDKKFCCRNKNHGRRYEHGKDRTFGTHSEKVREKFEKENPFEMSEAHQCVSLWILDHALVQAREVEKEKEEDDEEVTYVVF